MKSESEKLNAAISSYQNKFIKDYKKDVAAIKKGEKGNESLTSGYKVVTDNDKLFCLRIDTVIARAAPRVMQRFSVWIKNPENKSL